MKSKFKSLFFWAAFFFLLITLMFFGSFFSFPYIIDDYYADLIYYFLCVSGYSFIVLYFIFSILIFMGKLPEKIKRIEKLRYLAVMFILLLTELMIIGSALPDFE